MTQSIPLTQGKFALVDDDLYPLLSQYRWCYHVRGYAVTCIHYKTVYMHRMVMNAQPGQLVDHIDGDKLNNTRANLRFATAAQNQQNKAPRTGFKGVTFTKGRWHARIKVQGKLRYLGAFDDPTSAALLYDAAARYFFGAFACPNLPADQMTAAIQDKLHHRHPPSPGIEKRPSPYRGVTWDRGRWRVRISVNNRRLHLGHFQDEITAARVYDQQARLLHGANATLNFPDAPPGHEG